MSTRMPTDTITGLDLQSPFLQAILDTLPIALMVYELISDSDFRVVFVNPIADAADNNGSLGMLGKRLDEIMPGPAALKVIQRFQECIASGQSKTIEDSYQLEEFLVWIVSTATPMRDTEGRTTHILVTWKDITIEKQRILADQQRQAEIIEQQIASLAELSTPLLTISETTVVMPLVGAVDSRRVAQMMETLLQGVAESHAAIVILDITGVSIVDTQVANAFIRASQAVQLLGAQVVLTGIRPEVAQTMVQLGVNLGGIVTRGTLRDGINYALRQ